MSFIFPSLAKLNFYIWLIIINVEKGETNEKLDIIKVYKEYKSSHLTSQQTHLTDRHRNILFRIKLSVPIPIKHQFSFRDL